MSNIFIGNGLKVKFAHIIYNELMKREFVSLCDILLIYYNRNKEYYDKVSYSKEPGYGELKKAFPEVVRAINSVCPNSIIDNGKTGKGAAKKYIGTIDDPLADERKAVVQKTIEDYVIFCKDTAGLVPPSWFSSFFENTQLLLDTNKQKIEGNNFIRSSLEQNLTNIELLPILHRAITDKQVLRISYQSFGQDSLEIVFHPQFLKEYNGRWFVLGEANRAPYHAYNIPLDRIKGEMAVLDNIEYIPPEKGFYQNHFNNIVGVTHERDAQEEIVIIRTKTEYQHGLILTKPFHHSQKETLPYGEYNGQYYGEISLLIEPNRELRGKILAYGQYVEVVKPESLRSQIKDIVENLYIQYQ
ncbi:MAG: WYL domain-containing protein [Bacteroidales bacterium]|nr:WYL domain-containing protein [Bacteroidales bacterium]